MYCCEQEYCYFKREQSPGGGEHYKGGTDFCITLTLLLKDQLGVKLEIIHLHGHSVPRKHIGHSYLVY
jgi:hypothetical protein